MVYPLVQKFERKRVGKDGYIITETWYSKFERGKMVEEPSALDRGFEDKNGRWWSPDEGRLEREYKWEQKQLKKYIIDD